MTTIMKMSTTHALVLKLLAQHLEARSKVYWASNTFLDNNVDHVVGTDRYKMVDDAKFSAIVLLESAGTYMDDLAKEARELAAKIDEGSEVPVWVRELTGRLDSDREFFSCGHFIGGAITDYQSGGLRAFVNKLLNPTK